MSPTYEELQLRVSKLSTFKTYLRELEDLEERVNKDQNMSLFYLEVKLFIEKRIKEIEKEMERFF